MPLKSTTDDVQGRQYHDKTSYNIMPTPPSPTRSSQPISQSTPLSSTSQSSMSHPITPPRGRPSSRYPESLGRVPLHRRGTSKTYERLEDLLREAGYKETRIFTPETDRVEAEGSKTNGEGRRGSVRGGVGAVVGFLAGLMPSGISRTSSVHRISLDENKRDPSSGPLASQISVRAQPEYSPTSPLLHKQPARPPSSGLSERPPMLANPSSLSEGFDATKPTVSTPSTPHSGFHAAPSTPTPPRHQLVHRISQNQLPHQAHKPILSRGGSNSSLGSTIAQHPSRAGAYLRHMTSAPNIPERPSSRHATSSRQFLVLNDSDTDGEGADPEIPSSQPPLPRTWLQTVARAVAFGGPGAYVGGPNPSNSKGLQPTHNGYLHSKTNTSTTLQAPPLRQTRSSLSQITIKIESPSRPRSHLSRAKSKVMKSKSGALLDHTNRLTLSSSSSQLYRTASSMSLAPPPMCAQIQSQRSSTSEGKVSQTRVVCRSAPVSRAGSRVRGTSGGEVSVLTGEAIVDLGLSMDINGSDGARRKADTSRPQRGRGRGWGPKKRDGVPSLAQTRVEGDIWDTYTGAGEPNRYLSGWGVGDNDPDNEPENSSSEEEDGELDLARILVPPKRQNSIQSLRKHLHLQAGTHRDNLGKPKGAARPGIGSRSVTAISIWRDDDNEGEDGEDEDWGQGWRRKRTRRRSHEEGEEEGDRVAVLLDGKSGTGVGKRRRGIPWAQWAGVAS